MKSTLTIERAKKRAAELHAGQFRKDEKTPYIEHLYAVADILSEYTDDEDIIVAGLMHDTLEDVPGYTHADLAKDFGNRVADIVEGVTEERFPKYLDLTREERVQKFEEMLARNLQKLEQAGAASLVVVSADKIHNLLSMAEGVQLYGKEYISRFKMPLEQKLRHFGNMLDLVKKHSKNDIALKFEDTLRETSKVFYN